MKCATALSADPSTEVAVAAALRKLEADLQGKGADFATIFATLHHAGSLKQVSETLRDRLSVRHVIGCTGESIIGEDREIEGAPALSLWAIRLENAEIRAIRLEGSPSPDEFHDAEIEGSLLLLGDPFSFPADEWFKSWRDSKRNVRVFGGMASASRHPGGNRLVLDDRVHADGAVGLLIGGGARIRSAVSQGCKPIGRTFVITKVDRNIILELGRRSTVEVFREIFEELSDADKIRVRAGLHVGRVINEYQEEFNAGDFLIRNVVGATESGGIAITDLVRVGQTVRFHIRDAETADEDLRGMLAPVGDSTRAVGSLIFSCNGRGTRLFDSPDHDVTVARDVLGPIPSAGFFAMGEFGPVGGQNFVHGFTASVVVFEEK